MAPDAPLPLPARQFCGQVDTFVNDVQVAIVVQHAFAAVVTRENGQPEVDVGLELVGQWERFLSAGMGSDQEQPDHE